jgi:hypothetical protein
VDYDLVDLAVTNEDATYDSSGMWTIKGEVTNNSGATSPAPPWSPVCLCGGYPGCHELDLHLAGW